MKKSKMQKQARKWRNMELQYLKSIFSTFPTDLILEILLRLPEKSIVRFRCVSKLWLSITTDPYFISLFETRNPRPRLLLCFKEDDELVVSSIPQHTLTLDPNSRNSSSKSNNPYRMKFPKFTDYKSPTASVHGLICFRNLKTVIVWNPSTRKFLGLPKPSESWSEITVCLGYDAVEGKHKVIAMPLYRASRKCRVITLGATQESWRTVKTKHEHKINVSNAFGQCINGVIYYLASTSVMFGMIMRFDVRSEKLDAIQLPSNIRVDMLITYVGRLACVQENTEKKRNGITLLILEDAEEIKWSSKDFFVPCWHYDHQGFRIASRPKGYTEVGEFIYIPYHRYVAHKSLYVLFFDLFDPVRNSYRTFQFKRIAHNKKRMYPLHIFPNHIETQTSL